MRKNKGYITIAGAIIFSSIIICFSIITNKPTKPSFDHLTINVEKTPAEQIIINNNSNYPDGLFGVKIRTDIKDYLHDKDQLLFGCVSAIIIIIKIKPRATVFDASHHERLGL